MNRQSCSLFSLPSIGQHLSEHANPVWVSQQMDEWQQHVYISTDGWMPAAAERRRQGLCMCCCFVFGFFSFGSDGGLWAAFKYKWVKYWWHFNDVWDNKLYWWIDQAFFCVCVCVWTSRLESLLTPQHTRAVLIHVLQHPHTVPQLLSIISPDPQRHQGSPSALSKPILHL